MLLRCTRFRARLRPCSVWVPPSARWVIAATVLGSGVAFLDGTVVNVALPAIGRDLHTDVAGLQWTLDAYLVTLTALLLFGGALGDRFGRKRVFIGGLVAFTVASVGCARGAERDRARPRPCASRARAARSSCPAACRSSPRASPTTIARAAIGAWSGLAAISGAVGPFLGGWLVDAASWRWVFLVNVPIAAVTIVDHRACTCPRPARTIGLRSTSTGAVLASVGLGGVCWALIEGPQSRRRRCRGRGAGRRRRDRRVPRAGGPPLASDAAARALPIRAVQRRERHDARGLRRARCRVLHDRARAAARDCTTRRSNRAPRSCRSRR